MTLQADPVDDIAVIIPSRTVKVAAALTMLSGVVTLGLAVQASTLLNPIGVYRLSPLVFAALGLGALVSGARVSRMRAGSAHWSVALAALMALAGLTWFVLALKSGVLLVMALALAPLAIVAIVASLLSLALVERATAARKRLRAQGLDSGL